MSFAAKATDFVGGLQKTFDQHKNTVQEQIENQLKEYFDPKDGRFTERVQRLVSQDGELSQFLKSYIDGENSTLRSHARRSRRPRFAVFVPVAFFPGTTGRLYQQFSLTIAFSVALSAFNALTLSPALSALLLDAPAHGKRRFFRCFERIFDAGTHGYVAPGRLHAPRWAWCWCSSPALGADGVGLSAGADGVPAGRGPGLLHHPGAGARGRVARYTGLVAQQAETSDGATPEIAERSSRSAASASRGRRRTRAILFARLKPYDERRDEEHSARRDRRACAMLLGGIPGAIVVRSRRRRFRAWAASAASSSSSSTRRGGTSRTWPRRRRRDGRGATSRRGAPGCSPRSPPTIRSSS